MPKQSAHTHVAEQLIILHVAEQVLDGLLRAGHVVWLQLLTVECAQHLFHVLNVLLNRLAPLRQRTPPAYEVAY